MSVKFVFEQDINGEIDNDEVIVCKEVLPEHLRVGPAHRKLSEIGLYVPVPKNAIVKWYSNPHLISIILGLFIIQNYLLLVIPPEYELTHIILGDWSELLGIGDHLKIATLCWGGFNIAQHMIYYYNFNIGNEPTFMGVFEMMSGMVTPNSIGLSDPQTVFRLMRISRILFSLTNYIASYQALGPVTLLVMLAYAYNTLWWQTLVFGVPNAMFYGVVCYCHFRISLWHLNYFYLMCLYLKFKIQTLNTIIIELISTKRYNYFINMWKIFHSINRVYVEINEYNSSYWSKYLLSVWLLLGSVVIFGLFIVIFMTFNMFTKLILAYMLSIIVTMFLFIIFTASSLHSEVNNSRKTLNELYFYQMNTTLFRTQKSFILSLKV